MSGGGAPDLHPSNPGRGVTLNLSWEDGAEENYNVVKLLMGVFLDDGDFVEPDTSELYHPRSGLILRPRIVDLSAIEGGGVRTVTTIEVRHPTLLPEGAFEYQHSAGDNLEEAFRRGFETWIQADFPVFRNALLDELEDCTALVFDFPERPNRPAKRRRLVLGPLVYGAARTVPKGPDACSHPSCPTCLFMRVFKPFTELLESDETACVRLFAMRDQAGQTGADCRVNGEDFDSGREALAESVEGWAGEGFEFRKQLLLIQSLPEPD